MRLICNRNFSFMYAEQALFTFISDITYTLPVLWMHKLWDNVLRILKEHQNTMEKTFSINMLFSSPRNNFNTI